MDTYLYNDWGRVRLSDVDEAAPCIWREHTIAAGTHRLLFRTSETDVQDTPQCCIRCAFDMVESIHVESLRSGSELSSRDPLDNCGVGCMTIYQDEAVVLTCLGCGKPVTDEPDRVVVLYQHYGDVGTVLCHPTCWPSVSDAIVSGLSEHAAGLLGHEA